LEYDDVMNKQRTAVYGLRGQLLEGLDQKELILEDYVANLLSALMEAHAPEAMHPDQWDVNGLKGQLASQFGIDLEKEGIHLDTLDRHELGEAIFDRLKEKYEMKEAILGGHTMRLHERMVMLSVLDGLWKDHLLNMDHLKEGIGLRGYGQQDPLVAYKKESFDMFEAMMGRFQEDTVRFLFLMQIVGPDGQPVSELPRRQAPEITSQSVPEPVRALPQGAPVRVEGNGTHAAPATPPSRPLEIPVRAPSTTIDALEQEFQRKKKRELEQARMTGANGSSDAPAQRRAGEKVGRNDLCPCGSGKKYKKCHGVDA
jgi:preprotein translocase subunit SecA